MDERVTTYRVREFDCERYIVEVYTMKLLDEMRSYTEQYGNYYIRYNEYPMQKARFQSHLAKKCRENEYQEPTIAGEGVDWVNNFLATHYFKQSGSSVSSQILSELNELADHYIKEYNASLWNGDSQAPGYADAGGYLRRVQDDLLKNEIVSIKCMNVGQANFSLGYNCEGKPWAIFDLGVRSGNSAVANRSYAKNELAKLDENGIAVISHYDFDHINGYRYMSKAAVQRLWILPEKRLAPSPGERNLLNMLLPDHCIFLRNIDYNVTPFDKVKHVLTIRNLEIYQGNARKRDGFQSTSENARSLLCLVRKDKSILLPADCLYEEFPTKFQVDYIVVPHHCCRYDNPIKNLELSTLKELIIPAGPNRRYHHPNCSHIQELAGGRCISGGGQRCIGLLNHSYFCFDGGTEIACPLYIELQNPFYKVIL